MSNNHFSFEAQNRDMTKNRNKKRGKISKPRQSKIFFSKKRVTIIGTILGVIATLVGFFSDIGGFYSQLIKNRKLDVSIAYFENQKGQLQLVSPDAVMIKVKPEDYLAKRIPFPLNLALRNKDNASLEVVRVELSYKNTMHVKSSGKAKIDPENKRFIYEHEIGTLENVNHYTPLQTIDTLYLPFSFVAVEVCALLKDGVPIYTVVITSGVENFRVADILLYVPVTVYCKDRPTSTETILLTLRSDIQLIGLPDSAKFFPFQKNTKKDRMILQELEKAMPNILVHWQKYSMDGYSIDYKKISYQNNLYQIVQIDDQTRLVVIDENADGRAEYQLMDTTKDGIIDTKAVFKRSELMLDWKPEAVR